MAENKDEIGRQVVELVEGVQNELGVTNHEIDKLLGMDKDLTDSLVDENLADGISIGYLAKIVDLTGKKLVLKIK